MKVVASVTDADTKAIATRIPQFIRNRFPTAAGTATDGGFTFALDGQHVGTVTIGKNFVELEAGPDRITTSKVRDAERRSAWRTDKGLHVSYAPWYWVDVSATLLSASVSVRSVMPQALTP